MDLRPIAPADLPACSDVFFAAEDELYGRRGLPPLPRNRPALERLFGHIIATNRGLSWLAERDGRVVAFGMASQRERFWFLSFLFVDPEEQSRGLGRQLLELCLPAKGTVDVMGTCVEAIQPVSTGLYASYGLVPRVPLYTLVGRLAGALPALPHGLEVVPFLGSADATEPAGVQPDARRDGPSEAIDRLDRTVQGFGRAQDHRALRDWQRSGYALREGDDVVGYGYVQPSGRLGPVVTLDPAHLLPLVGELTRLVPAVEAWQILVPGPAKETMTAILRAGLRFDGPPAIVCTTRPGPDFERFLPGSFAIL